MTHTEAGIIVGLEKIDRMFDRSRWSVARWIRKEAFPAARLPDGRWFTTIGLIEAWLMERRAHDPLLNETKVGDGTPR